MFLPIGDDNRDRKTIPVVNYLLIVINILAFVFWQHFGLDTRTTFAYATVPAEILTGHDIVTPDQVLIDPYTGHSFELPGLQPTGIPVFLTLITSLFLHGGWAHLGGNMLYLAIFGDNLEDALGHGHYLVFYLLCGILAGLSHVFCTFVLGQNLLIPSMGASGAISGVLGGYIVLFPRKKVYIWMLLFIISVPALVAVGCWFFFQVVNGLGALGGEAAGGVAYAAHIGGFLFGMLLIRRFARKFLTRRGASKRHRRYL
jgi:membrane associated rhomboid family serine protease